MKFAQETDLKAMLLAEASKSYSEEDVEALRVACEMSKKYASNFCFNGKELTIDSHVHSLKMAIIIVRDLRLDIDSTLSSVLMYCEENEEIAAISKPKIKSIVRRIRKIFGIEVDNLDMNAEYFRKLLVNISEDLRVLVICLVDRLVSMSELSQFPEELQDKFCKEVDRLFAPLAHRIGLYGVYTDLCNSSFKHFHENEYAQIDKIREEKLSLHKEKIDTFINSIDGLLKDKGYKYVIKNRVKSPYSIWNKIENKKVSFAEIYDLFAVRVIFDYADNEIDEKISEIEGKIGEEDKVIEKVLCDINELNENLSVNDERKRELERNKKDFINTIRTSKMLQKELQSERSKLEEAKAMKERAECWNIYALVDEKYKLEESRFRDWLSKPRENGYESLHTTICLEDNIFVELQIRSKRMDKIAEFGLAAHWQYKEKSATTSLEKWLAKVRNSVEEDKFSIGNILDEFKHDSENEQIYVFTPDKELRRMQADSTILDFAYEIHSQIGNKCVGGIVNGKQIVEEVNGRTVKRIEGGVNVDKSYKIQNGETISIRTSKNQRPSLDWLKIAVTNKAKYNIRKSLDDDYHEKVDEGKEILKRKLKNWKYDFTEHFNDIVNYFGYKFGSELFFDIATEKLNTLKIKSYLDNKSVIEDNLNAQNETKGAERQQVGSNKTADSLYRVDDDKVVRYESTKCCEDIQSGEEVFGFFSSTGEIKVHRVSCPNAADLFKKYPYRIVELKWGK